MLPTYEIHVLSSISSCAVLAKWERASVVSRRSLVQAGVWSNTVPRAHVNSLSRMPHAA
jgi:hypothetical protein